MPDSESGALPLGDTPIEMWSRVYKKCGILQVFLYTKKELLSFTYEFSCRTHIYCAGDYHHQIPLPYLQLYWGLGLGNEISRRKWNHRGHCIDWYGADIRGFRLSILSNRSLREKYGYSEPHKTISSILLLAIEKLLSYFSLYDQGVRGWCFLVSFNL